MLPSAVVLPLWLAIAWALPLLQTLHALRARSGDRGPWLCYWMCLALGLALLRRCEWLMGVASSVLPLWNEAQLVAVLVLVLPRTRGVARAHAWLRGLAARLAEKGSARAMEAVQRAASAGLKAGAPPQDTMGEGPGMYCILAPAAVTSHLQPTQETIVKQLSVGETVQVLSVVRDGPRLRARVQEPAGWISLLNCESGKRWAQSCEGTALEGRGLQEGLAAAAASVGCDPCMLLGVGAGQVAGKAGSAAPEVDAAAAWEAVALLESQLSRADDLSEAPGVRQASGMLRSMLGTLAAGGNPAALAMAQTLVPDIGTIWAHEGAREYLRALLLGPNHASGEQPSRPEDAPEAPSGG
mmetsp:Transcript_68033/g.210462  ORF Transcript_68033/g.210462 Transcript_68033/m.210462 type:complete len:355 (-) Transcript_68033:109-1173(-)